MWGHGPRAVVWPVLETTPSVSCVGAFSRSSEHLYFQFHCRLSMRPRDGWDTPRVLHRARRIAWSSAVACALGPL
eukprot:14696893-Alexandrium_andersonii.AAC.1